MDVAWKLLTEGLHKWTIIVAEEQYKGRGRHGRTWASPKGGLWMSLIVDRNVIKEVPLNMYPFIAPLAVISSIDKIYNIKTHIRWPNDIVFKGKKIGGILIETSFKGNNIEGVIIGIGINTNITNLPISEADSLLRITGKKIENSRLMELIFNELVNLINKSHRDIKEKYKARLETLGKNVRIITTDKRIIEDKVVDIGDNGEIILEKNREKIDYFSVIKLTYMT